MSDRAIHAHGVRDERRATGVECTPQDSRRATKTGQVGVRLDPDQSPRNRASLLSERLLSGACSSRPRLAAPGQRPTLRPFKRPFGLPFGLHGPILAGRASAARASRVRIEGGSRDWRTGHWNANA